MRGHKKILNPPPIERSTFKLFILGQRDNWDKQLLFLSQIWNGNNSDITAITQTLSSPTHFPSRIRSSTFAVPLHTLQPPTYTSSSPCLIPSCQWPVGGCLIATGGFSHSAEIKMPVGIVRSVVILCLGRNRGAWRPEPNFSGHWDRGF